VTADELAEQDLDDLRWVISTPQGQRFAARVIDRWARLEEKSETGEERSTAFNDGMREVGRCLVRAVEAASSIDRFDLFTLMRNEYRRECRGAPRAPEG
jgi:alkanesulfonate monooxygenase SsuD/methylene tetrahydromethanopterin reductase-like flavin-dependent oxidoreductase (luciferase family)